MRERIKTIALAVVCLALAGLLVWQLWPREEHSAMVNEIPFDPTEITSVDMTAHMQGFAYEHNITITSQADIDELCALWNGTWVVAAHVYEGEGRPPRDEPAGGVPTVDMVFHMADGDAISYRAGDLYIYNWTLDAEERVFYTYGPSKLADALEDFILARVETEVAP